MSDAAFFVLICFALVGAIVIQEILAGRLTLASADTHPKDGDVKQAPLVSGAVASALPTADAQSPAP